jgi:hypothetical protein
VIEISILKHLLILKHLVYIRFSVSASFILDAVTQQYTFMHNIVPMVFFISGVSMLFGLGVALAADFVQDRYLSMKLAHKAGGKIDG